MRWWIWFLIAPLLALTPTYPTHDTVKKVDDEFTALANDAQAKQFTVWTTTPSLSQLRDGEMIIFASTTVVTSNKLMFRYNQEIFAVNASCITVRR